MGQRRQRFALWLLKLWHPSAYGQIKGCRDEQRRRQALVIQHGRLLHAHEAERRNHRAKIAECEQLKALTNPALLRAWIDERKTQEPAR